MIEIMGSQELIVTEITSFYQSVTGGYVSRLDPWASTKILFRGKKREAKFLYEMLFERRNHKEEV